jgi:hypothetical protein
MTNRKLVTAALVFGTLMAMPARSAFAQSFSGGDADFRLAMPSTLFNAADVSTSSAAAVPVAPVTPVATVAPAALNAAPIEFRQPRTSSLLSHGLMGMYASTAVLQMLDVRSTYAVIGRGGYEGNPLLSGIVQNKVAFVAVKAGIAAATIMAARQMAHKNKVAALVTMVAINSVYASVVSHNFKLASQLR